MKTTCNLSVSVPEGRRPGKFLGRLAPTRFYKLSELVESLTYHVQTCESEQDYRLTAIECHSCQSKDPGMYANVWLAVQNVNLIALTKGDKIVARTLVNWHKGTFAPIYGAKHYLLEARLRFVGLKPGAVASLPEVEKALATGLIERLCLVVKRS